MIATEMMLSTNMSHMTHSAPKLVINRCSHSTRFIGEILSPTDPRATGHLRPEPRSTSRPEGPRSLGGITGYEAKYSESDRRSELVGHEVVGGAEELLRGVAPEAGDGSRVHVRVQVHLQPEARHL